MFPQSCIFSFATSHKIIQAGPVMFAIVFLREYKSSLKFLGCLLLRSPSPTGARKKDFCSFLSSCLLNVLCLALWGLAPSFPIHRTHRLCPSMGHAFWCATDWWLYVSMSNVWTNEGSTRQGETRAKKPLIRVSRRLSCETPAWRIFIYLFIHLFWKVF